MAKEKHKTFLFSVAGQWVENFSKDLRSIFILHLLLKFIYSGKATKFFEISTIDLSYVVPVKSTLEISQNFVAFTDYMNCITRNFLDP